MGDHVVKVILCQYNELQNRQLTLKTRKKRENITRTDREMDGRTDGRTPDRYIKLTARLGGQRENNYVNQTELDERIST